LPGNSRRPEDKQNYVLLLKELRRQLNAVPNEKYLLTVA
jgi:chitinase